MTSIIEKMSTYVSSIEYTGINPESLILCVPAVAEIVHAIQLRTLSNKVKRGQMSTDDAIQQSKLSSKILGINVSHVLGALARTIMCIALAIVTKNAIFGICAGLALCHYFYALYSINDYQIRRWNSSSQKGVTEIF
ncbi:MAG: hypothetical protein JWO53_619 [Chlamydiia bacterium]|nr:hypothetical protein [Chlamydiia bacterium]